jgi:N-acetylglucosaminyldiphosphoundecaprenol N-acetyl-beta-D-mannosaminyltransferase
MKMGDNVLTMRVDAISRKGAAEKVLQWIRKPRGRYVCVANVHMCMECFDEPAFGIVVNQADMVVADGRPLVWAKKLLGNRSASHVRGSDLMHDLFDTAEQRNITVGFYGSTDECLDGLKMYINDYFPKLKVAIDISPPFRPLEEKEDREHIDQINNSGVKILFIGLGCPKQELWMAAHLEKVNCVMVGVGAAFDFFSGQKKQAPVWMQRAGLEWIYRFGSEPRRLWKRYLTHNPRFVWYFLKQFLGYDHILKRWGKKLKKEVSIEG